MGIALTKSHPAWSRVCYPDPTQREEGYSASVTDKMWKRAAADLAVAKERFGEQEAIEDLRWRATKGIRGRPAEGVDYTLPEEAEEQVRPQKARKNKERHQRWREKKQGKYLETEEAMRMRMQAVRDTKKKKKGEGAENKAKAKSKARPRAGAGTKHRGEAGHEGWADA